MEICKIDISNFRGIKKASLLLNGNTVFVGDNNTGKSSIFEAIDLVMGPDRLNKRPVINEHDFFAGEYIHEDDTVEINIEVTVARLSEEQQIYFGNHIEWWDRENKRIITGPPASDTDKASVIPAIRLAFVGSYDSEEDDFVGQTYFAESLKEGHTPEKFGKKDKRKCGFLYLRALRTGSRALSFDRGSLLDIVLQLEEMRPRMWEETIDQLRCISVAGNPDLNIENILLNIQKEISSVVTYETANKPQIKVSNLTREHLRKIITVFLGSGAISSDGLEYSVPYYLQGTGTINILVLSLLSMIAELKDSVIFAMEEPETALPPHIQKRAVLNVIQKSNQALFTSHSPYVLEEFHPDSIIVISNKKGEVFGNSAGMPPTIKKKQYHDDFRRRFCEALLARRVLIVEGRTEYDVYIALGRKYQEQYPEKSYALELLGIAPVCADSDSQIANLGEYYRGLNKVVYAVFDKQTEESLERIKNNVDYVYEAQEKGIEKVFTENMEPSVLLRFGIHLVNSSEWPQSLKDKVPNEDMSPREIRDSLFAYFKQRKGDGALAGLVEYCDISELPNYVRETIKNIHESVYPLEGQVG